MAPTPSGFARVEVPPSICVSPTDPAIDPTVAIPAIVEQEFQRVVVLRAVAEVRPAPDTLVNLPTRFQTSTTERYDIPLTILGRSVVITAQAESWAWTLGDGSTATSAAGHGYLEHTYTRTGTVTARADTTWSGTFRVDGGPAHPITGRAQTTGEPVQVVIKQARSRLVGG